jgi:cadmium resistance protein CadD (predicted permease)
MVLLWVTNFLVALWWLLDFTNNPQILAALWGFVTLEMFWLASRWSVLYQIPNVPFILSQYSMIITALAYGWGGIYYHYKQRTLKKTIIIEYLAVTVVVFIVLVVMNRWTGTG